MFAKSPSRAELLHTAQALCDAFASKADVDALLAHFSATHQITAVEHGLPALAPFLGRVFAGRTGPASVPAYFRLLQQHLTYEAMSFSSWVVDPDAQRVAVKGRARFTWRSGAGAGQAWDEEFAYVLDFDQDAKVTDYQVWADSGAAYLARKGELAQLTQDEGEGEGKVRMCPASTGAVLHRADAQALCTLPQTQSVVRGDDASDRTLV